VYNIICPVTKLKITFLSVGEGREGERREKKRIVDYQPSKMFGERRRGWRWA